MTKQAMAFVLVGLLAGAVNVVARIAFSSIVPYEIAVALAFPVALTVAFVLNRKHVFPTDQGAMGAQYTKFALVNVLALGQVWLISVCLAKFVFPYLGLTWHPETIAHVIGVASPIATSFLAYKYFVFRTQAKGQ